MKLESPGPSINSLRLLITCLDLKVGQALKCHSLFIGPRSRTCVRERFPFRNIFGFAPDLPMDYSCFGVSPF